MLKCFCFVFVKDVIIFNKKFDIIWQAYTCTQKTPMHRNPYTPVNFNWIFNEIFFKLSI